MEISTRGGELIRADLLKYPVREESARRAGPSVLSDAADCSSPRSGLASRRQRAEPTHLAIFNPPRMNIDVRGGPAGTARAADLDRRSGHHRRPRLTCSRPGSYRIDLIYDVENTSGSDWQCASYVQLVRHYEHVERSYFDVETYSFGPGRLRRQGLSQAQRRRRKTDRSFKATITDGWLASLQHQFVAAVVPPADAALRVSAEVDRDKEYVLS